ncbi:MAG: 5-methylthioadenosine/S-adenosylhomocysteine deaminase [Blastocatellia bacterium]|jgi:5-methylthioadenosine/S-adenosylhomocysteine deaminase|nr:5-methylthioadenosine/S-adenosylhomocysteine deaminase [Blastocatellia bacterium]
MNQSILIRNGTIVTMDQNDSIVRGDVLIRDGRIAEVGEAINSDVDETIDAHGCAVLPGFVQTHVHLCQTLFRGAADDLSLIDWLKQRVWPMEAAHTAKSIRASARLGIAELVRGGTTCALTMETVKHTEEVLRVVDETGFRATVGKCMMDKGEEVPAGLLEQTGESIRESVALIEKWHGHAGDRVRCCFAPRFAISCTLELLSQVSELARKHQVLIHTHASENKKECEIVESETGRRNVAYLESLGISGSHVVLAHCVHLDTEEMETLARTGTNVAHCPSSNLKLGSGLARVAEMLARRIPVSLGADGAACNNRLDMFTEMRTAALLQKLAHGPEVLPAARVLRLATIDGARALGLEKEIGSLEAGKRADVIVVKLDQLHSTPQRDVVSALVYSAIASDVRTTIIDGEVLMRDSELLRLNEASVIEEANQESKALAQRAGISVQVAEKTGEQVTSSNGDLRNHTS